MMMLALVFAATSAGLASPPAGASGKFQDCASCPQMISLEGGAALIGSPLNEQGRYRNEQTQQLVNVRPFAIGAKEVTRREYGEFIRSADYRPEAGCYTPGDLNDWASDLDPKASWLEPGFKQADDHPAVCVSWDDAQAYAAWLSKKTGRRYRLPTEVEWEFAARAGTATAYFWGDEIERGCTSMNGGDESLARGLPIFAEKTREYFRTGVTKSVMVPCNDGHVFTSTAGSYASNAFGLFDVIGNAWEWTVDCADDSPAANGCRKRRTRGGSWNDWPVDLRSSVKKRVEPEARRNDVGFRVASEIEVASQ